jgi:hypothetical protein
MNDAARYWRGRARGVALRHNIAWWLARFLPAAFAWSALTACVLLALRHMEISTRLPWIVFAVGVALLAGLAWGRARRQFLSATAGLVRLDVRLRLNNRLTAASAGVGEFPERQPADDGLSWRWPRLLAVSGGAVVILFAAANIPVGRAHSERVALEQPPAWTEVAEWADELEKSEAVEPEAVQKLRDQLGDLSSQPEENWYAQSSLEAGDALREQTADSIAALQRNLQAASSALAAAEGASQADAQALGQKLASAVEGLQMGNLPLRSEALAELKGLDPSKLRTLDPKRLAELRKGLGKGEKACAACLGPGGKKLAGAVPEAGNGGVDRGPGTAPLGLRDRPTDLHTQTTEALTGEDLSRALPGDVVAVQRSAPQADGEIVPAGESAGDISTVGTGGKAVWRDELSPQERKVLERFFK